MKKNLLTIVLKWGALMGITLAGCELVKMISRDINYDAGPVFSILLLIVLVLFLYGAIKEYRDVVHEGFIKFSKAYGMGSLVVLVTCVVCFGYMLIHYSCIDKNGLERMNKLNEEAFFAKTEKDTVSQEVVASYLAQSDSIVRMTYDSMVRDSLLTAPCDTFVKCQLERMLPVYKNRVTLRTQVDTIHFTYAKFQEFAQLCFMDVYQNLLSTKELQDNPACGQQLSAVVNNAHNSMAQINLINQAYEKNKDSIPHYTSVFPVSLSYAFSILLYGLFVTLFVALYLAKKKQNEEMPKMQ